MVVISFPSFVINTIIRLIGPIREIHYVCLYAVKDIMRNKKTNVHPKFSQKKSLEHDWFFFFCVGPKAWTLVVAIWIRTISWLLASILV